MANDQEADLAAVGIYAVMAHDPSDAIDLINECTSLRTLETLHTMLSTRGRPNADQGLNDLFAGPTKRRLDALRPTLGQVMARAQRIPEIGDHEIVVGPDGLAHLLVVTFVDNAVMGAGLAASLGFMCPCGIFMPSTQTDKLVIEPFVTCMRCLTA